MATFKLKSFNANYYMCNFNQCEKNKESDILWTYNGAWNIFFGWLKIPYNELQNDQRNG